MREAATHDRLDAPGRGVRGARCTPSSTRAYDDAERARAAGARSSTGSTPSGLDELARPEALQLTMPGVPDVYQGTELWEDSLVDPDNRRPVDFDARAGCSTALDAAGAPRRSTRPARPSCWSTRAPCGSPRPARAVRRLRPAAGGGVRGRPRRRIRPGRRDHGGHPVAGRSRRRRGLADTTLDLGGAATDVFTGRRVDREIRLAELLDGYPVALLVR